MATTTNYGWTTPDDTALVKDGAAAIRSLGSAIDTTTKNLNPGTTNGDIDYYATGTTKSRVAIGSSGQCLTVVAGVPSWAASATSVLTTTGDLLYASAANTLARRAIGSTGDVLTVSGGVPTWAAPGGGITWTQLASANFPTGTNTVTISGLSGGIIFITGDPSPTAANGFLRLRLNGDTGANYYSRNTYGTDTKDYILLNNTAAGASENYPFTCYITAASSSAPYKFIGMPFGSGYSEPSNYKSTSAITSVTLYLTVGNFDAGSYQIWKA